MAKTVSMTDVGRRRNLNQDYVFTADIPVGRLSNLYLVADGMGGHKAGGFASKYAVEVIVEQISSSKEQEVFEMLNHAITTANKKVRQKAQADESMFGMGTTMVAATIKGNCLRIANVGDSRLYIINDTITQITVDHSMVEEMIRMGGINREQARNHPKKNIITRAIGAEREIKPDFFEVTLHQGDRILMCTDGVSNMLTDGEMLQIIQQSCSEEEKVRQLVNMANEYGGRDNMGIILITPEV